MIDTSFLYIQTQQPTPRLFNTTVRTAYLRPYSTETARGGHKTVEKIPKKSTRLFVVVHGPLIEEPAVTGLFSLSVLY